MVKMLYVELDIEYRSYRNDTQFILVKLADALVKIPNLVDLRILHSQMEDSDKVTWRISEANRFVFRGGGTDGD